MTKQDSIVSLVQALRARVDWEQELGMEGYALAEPCPPQQGHQGRPGRIEDSPLQEQQQEQQAQTNQPRQQQQQVQQHAPRQQERIQDSPLQAQERTGEPRVGPEKAKQKTPASPDKSKAHALSELKFELENCTQCALHQKRNRIVFSDGTMSARLAFVGDFPLKEEDIISLPFVGARGHLLNKIILAIGERRETCYLCHVIKCTPGEAATPSTSEIQTCGNHLLRQLHLVQPQIVVALGQHAASFLLGHVAPNDTPIDSIRGTFVENHGFKIMPTFSLDHMLATPTAKRDVWEDMKQVKAALQS